MTAPFFEDELTADELSLLWRLSGRLLATRAKCDLLDLYYTGEHRVSNLNISIPGQLAKLHTVTGWARVAVDSLEERIDLQQFRAADNDVDTYLAELSAANNLTAQSHLAHLDAIIYGHSFVVLGTNDQPGGLPVVSVESPRDMTCDYDARTRAYTAALRMYSVDDDDYAVLYTQDSTITVTLNPGGGFGVSERDDHNKGAVPIVRLSNRQRISERAGSSEITPEIISITDSACRTLIGVEIAKEFYSVPQRYVLGASQTAFEDGDGNKINAWDAYMGKYLALERDETDQVPQVGTFTAYSPSVYTDVVEMYGKLMVALTGLPPQYLGLTFENPASADAIRMGEQRLVKRAERRQVGFSGPWSDFAALAVQWGTGEAPDPAKPIEPVWRDAATPTLAAQTDAVTKLVAAGVLPADSDVTLEMAGFDAGQVERIGQDRRRAQAQAARQAILAGMPAQTPGQPQNTAQGVSNAAPGSAGSGNG